MDELSKSVLKFMLWYGLLTVSSFECPEFGNVCFSSAHNSQNVTKREGHFEIVLEDRARVLLCF